ncbi:hypothetical protein D3C86_2209540 [compost metagenome]
MAAGTEGEGARVRIGTEVHITDSREGLEDGTFFRLQMDDLAAHQIGGMQAYL